MRVLTSKDRDLGLIRALVHGDSGVGKTTSFCSLPEKDTLIVSMERGLLPLRRMNFRVIQVESVPDLRELLVYLRKATVNTDGSISLMVKDDHVGDFKIVAFDSLSEIYAMFVRHLVETDRPALLDKRGSGDKPKELNIYEDMLGIEDFGVIYKRVMGFLSSINHLPVHTIFTCLTAWKEDKRTGIDRRVPAMHKSLSNDVPAVFDFVFHMEPMTTASGANTRVWRTANDGVFLCKDSTGLLDQFEPAHWPTIFRKVLASTTDKEESQK